MKRTTSILLVLALLLSFAIPVANAAETTHIVFSGGDDDVYSFVVGPEPRTYTFDIVTEKNWNMYGSFTNSDPAGRVWKWKGKGRTSLTLPLAENDKADVGHLSLFFVREAKTYDDLGYFSVVQLSAKDYARFNAICQCGADRIIDVHWSTYNRSDSDPNLRRIDSGNAKQHWLINNEGSVECHNCDKSLDDLFIFVYMVPESSERYYGVEKHDFAQGTVCMLCGYEREIKAKSIALTAPTKTLTLGGDDLQLAYTLKPANSNSTVKFTSGKPKVATVDEKTGLVTPVSAGTVTITAKTSSGKKATVKLTVVDPKAPLSVRIDPNKPLLIDIGQDVELNALLLPETAETKFTWTSSQKSVASVTTIPGEPDSKVVVSGLKKGVSWLSVKTANGKTNRIKVTVTKNVYTPPTP